MNFNLILKGKDKFYSKLNNKIYNILVIDDKKKLKYMNKKFKEFNNDKTIIALDFEFKKVSKESKEIAIAQINLENNLDNAYIFIFYPPELNNKGLKRFIKLLTNKDIIKVIHGGESLDIHYLFNSILKNNNNIKNFIYNLYDTKFLCEYYHIEKNIINKCSIYNFLEEFKIIDKKNIKYLNDLENKIGEIYLIEFDINNLNENLVEYALYDVIYLPTLIKKIIIISNIYKNIIKELTGIIYYYKRVEVNTFLDFSNKVNSFNNFFIILNNEKIKLIDIYYYYYYYKLSNSLIVKLSEITYFKNFIEILLKYNIYKNIEYNIYSSNNIIANEKLYTNLNEFLMNKQKIIKLFTIKTSYLQ